MSEIGQIINTVSIQNPGHFWESFLYLFVCLTRIQKFNKCTL